MNSTIMEKKLQASLVPNALQAEILKYVRELEKKVSDYGWVINPDRMGQ